MAFITSQPRWPGQCTHSFNVLEDTVKHALHLNEQEEEVRDDGRKQVATSQNVSPDNFYGSLLRRPFQAWSDLVIATVSGSLRMQAQAVIAHVHGKPTTLEKSKIENSSHVTVQCFQGPHVCLIDSALKIELRLAFLIEGETQEVPQVIGIAKAYRWHLNFVDQEFTMSQGYCNGPWLLSAKNVSGQFRFKMFQTEMDPVIEDCISDASSESCTSDDRNAIENVLQGVHSDFSDVRQALLNPSALREQCKK